MASYFTHLKDLDKVDWDLLNRKVSSMIRTTLGRRSAIRPKRWFGNISR